MEIVCEDVGAAFAGLESGVPRRPPRRLKISGAFIISWELFPSGGDGEMGTSDTGKASCCAILGDKMPKLIKESMSNNSSVMVVPNADRFR